MTNACIHWIVWITASLAALVATWLVAVMSWASVHLAPAQRSEPQQRVPAIRYEVPEMSGPYVVTQRETLQGRLERSLRERNQTP
jgi:hypothetical protein